MTEDLRTPYFADQIIMHQDAAVRFELRSRFEWNNEMLVTQADELSKVTVACNGGIRSYGHERYLTMRAFNELIRVVVLQCREERKDTSRRWQRFGGIRGGKCCAHSAIRKQQNAENKDCKNHHPDDHG